MSSIRGGVEQSRERLIALVLLLQRAWQYGSLTQEEIVRELKIDEFPCRPRGRARSRLRGNEGAVRQKFERDKARIRELDSRSRPTPRATAPWATASILERLRAADLLHAR